MVRESGLKKESVSLSVQERKLLKSLQEDARQTIATLAEHVAMSPTACWRAVRRMEEAGLIVGYHAAVSKAGLGYGVDAFVVVQIDNHLEKSAAEFENAVMAQDEIIECVILAGPADYQLRVVAEDIDSFYQFSRRTITRMPHVKEVRSSFVLKEVKKAAAIPVLAS